MAQLLTPKARKQYKKLPINIQEKFAKQLKLLAKNYRHPSLKTRKMGGLEIFEARIDLHYRFTFQLEAKNIYILTIGPHDKGLGEK